ncbi:MAG TPA: TolC family protein [Pirellulales bacterium]|jgi:outer membrane protein TolC|nr:TolC family protein [Pirellulales bacterium]
MTRSASRRHTQSIVKFCLVALLALAVDSRLAAVEPAPLQLRDAQAAGRQEPSIRPELGAAGAQPTESVAPPNADAVVPVEGDLLTIDLQTAWRLAGVQNPTINMARMAIVQAEVAQRQAALIWFPNLNAGGMLHQHSGAFISSFGQLRRLSETSLYFGGGARTVAAESNSVPMVQFFVPFADGLFNPLALRQQTAVMRYEATATSNSVLLDTTTAYFDLLAAETQVEAYHLSRTNLQQVVDTTAAYAQTGQGRQGDANRAAAEGYLLLVDLQGAEETLAVSSAALARLLHLDPSTRLKTPGGALRTFNIVDIERPLSDLIQVALRYRPELGARNLAIAESRTRVRQEQARPLLPLVTAGYSAGGFGGTGNFPNGASSAAPFTAVYNRTDLDAMAVWTLQNMGAGNISLVNRRRSQLDQSIYDRVRVVNQVRREVTEAYGYALGQRNEVRVSLRRLVEAEAAFREDYQRLLAFEALPIEVLNSARLLVTARTGLVQAFIGDNEAQFELFVAMGQPPFNAGDTLREQLPPQNVLDANQPPPAQAPQP